jgi:hypothetical protein
VSIRQDFFVIIISILLFQNGTTTLDSISSIYNKFSIAYAQEQNAESSLTASRNQQWIDKQSNTKVLFTYSPDKPLSGTLTELIFDIQDINTGAHFKDVLATVTIIDGAQQQVPIKFSNIAAHDGHFSIKYRFANEGTYQIIVKVNSNNSALALASFKVVVPFQPIGVFNTNHIFPLLIPVVLVGIIGTMAILAFIIVANRSKNNKSTRLSHL